MKNDYLEIENAEGMPNLADSALALDFLLSAKSAVRFYAAALTEAATPEVRMTLRNDLYNAIDMHKEITELMIKKGWLHPYNVNEQFQLDKKSTEMALKIAGMKLFPGNTSRLGTFATPHQ
ncbi:MAG: spore coat protein [Clostridia bacterium]|nr:spore coat protein [Clostridia bacterium]